MAVHSVMPPACGGGSCQLFGIFGISVQCFIGFWCVFTLACLWRCETPRRDFCTWVGDMSKQMLGAGWAHFMNVFFAIIFGEALDSDDFNNQCVWYLMGFLSDILVVTIVCWFVMTNLRPVIHDKCGIDIGEYDSGHGPKEESHESEIPELEDGGVGLSWWFMWSLQVAIWIAILSIVKGLVFFGAYLSQDWIYTGIATGFHWGGLCGHEDAQLVTSVIIIPVIGDAFQFAIQDGFLKRRIDQHESEHSSEGKYYQEQPRNLQQSLLKGGVDPRAAGS